VGAFDFLKPKKSDRPSRVSDIEAELARLRAERKVVEAAVESHSTRRANLLLTTASDEDIVRLDADANLSRVRLERLELAEVELSDRIDQARSVSDRLRRAVEAERTADRIEEATKALEASLATLGTAFAELVAAIPQRTGLERRHVGQQLLGPATAEEVGRAVLARALYSVVPGAFETSPSRRPWSGGAAVEKALLLYVQDGGALSERLLGFEGEGSTIPPASIFAEATIVGRLRAEAAALREPITEPQVAAE